MQAKSTRTKKDGIAKSNKTKKRKSKAKPFLDDANKWMDEMEDLSEDQFKAHFDLENPVVFDITDIVQEHKKNTIAKLIPVRSIPIFVFVQPLNKPTALGGLYLRPPSQCESEFDKPENLYLVSDEIFHPKAEYIKCKDAWIHPSLLDLIRQKVGADFSPKDAVKLCINYLVALCEMNSPHYEVIPYAIERNSSKAA